MEAMIDRPINSDIPDIDESAGLPHHQKMYAIAFDLDTDTLSHTYGNASHNNAYADIRRFLESRGFQWRQGSVYFGNPEVNDVACFLAVQALSRTYPWFSASVRDIQMLRIEANSDLRPVLEMGN